MICHSCGAPLTELSIVFDYTTGAVVSGNSRAVLGPVQLHTLECIIDAYPRGVTAEAIFVEVYGDMAEKTLNVVRVNISNIQRKLLEGGFEWEIVRLSGTKDRPPGYALLPTSTSLQTKWA